MSCPLNVCSAEGAHHPNTTTTCCPRAPWLLHFHIHYVLFPSRSGIKNTQSKSINTDFHGTKVQKLCKGFAVDFREDTISERWVGLNPFSIISNSLPLLSADE